MIEFKRTGLALEKATHVLALIVDITAEELVIDILSVGSMTWKRHDAQSGFEPEVLRVDGQRVTLSRLVKDEYSVVTESVTLPTVTAEVLPRLVLESDGRQRNARKSEVGSWPRAQVQKYSLAGGGQT